MWQKRPIPLDKDSVRESKAKCLNPENETWFVDIKKMVVNKQMNPRKMIHVVSEMLHNVYTLVVTHLFEPQV